MLFKGTIKEFWELSSEQRASVEEIDLTDHFLEDWDLVGDAFNECKALKVFRLNHSYITSNAKRFDSFCKALQKCSAVEIDLSYNDLDKLTAKQWQKMTEALVGKILKKLNLSTVGPHFSFESEAFTAFCDFIQIIRVEHIETFSLEWATLQQWGEFALALKGKNLKKLRVLDNYASIHTKGEEFKAVCEILKTLPIGEMDLFLDRSQWQEMSDALKTKKFKKLKLSYNSLGSLNSPSSAFTSLLSILECSSREVDLSSNCLGGGTILHQISINEDSGSYSEFEPEDITGLNEDQFLALGTAINQNKTLQFLNLSDNYFWNLSSKPKAFTAVCHILRHGHMAEVDLTRNELEKLTIDQCKELAVALVENVKIRKLSLSLHELIALSEPQFNAFYTVLKESKTTLVIDFTYYPTNALYELMKDKHFENNNQRIDFLSQNKENKAFSRAKEVLMLLEENRRIISERMGVFAVHSRLPNELVQIVSSYLHCYPFSDAELNVGKEKEQKMLFQFNAAKERFRKHNLDLASKDMSSEKVKGIYKSIGEGFDEVAKVSDAYEKNEYAKLLLHAFNEMESRSQNGFENDEAIQLVRSRVVNGKIRVPKVSMK